MLYFRFDLPIRFFEILIELKTSSPFFHNFTPLFKNYSRITLTLVSTHIVSLSVSENSSVLQSLNEIYNLMSLEHINFTYNAKNRILDVLANIRCKVAPASDSIVDIDHHHPILLISLFYKLNGLNNKTNSCNYNYNYRKTDLEAFYR